MTGKHWARVILLSAATAALPPVRSLAQPTDNTAAGNGASASDVARVELEQLRLTLFDRDKNPRERDEAAKRLLQRGANDVLLDALREGRSELKVPVARALADTPSPPPEFLDDLLRCLQPKMKADLAEAASQAIANYRDVPVARARLRDYILGGNVDERCRVAAIRALGTLTDRDTAQFLVETLLKGDVLPQVGDAAADALAEMTGLNEFGRDVGQWDQWWRAQPQSPQEFLAKRREERESRLGRTSDELRLLAESLNLFVQDTHLRIVDPADRDANIIRCLKHPRPEFRAAGAELVKLEKNNNRTVGPAVVNVLRELIGDSSPDVRRKVASAVIAINDPAAAKPLLAQLQRERIPAVKAALIDALAPSKNVAAVADLIKLLNDPSFQVSEAAAKALAELGPEIAKNQATVREVSNALVLTITRIDKRPGANRLRERVVEAMIPLKDQGLVRPLFPLLVDEAGNTPTVRNAAIRALSTMNAAPNVQADIAGQLATVLLRDGESGCRLEAANALGIVGSSAEANALYTAMNPAREQDAAVRDAAWKSLSSLFDQFSVVQLFSWGEQNFPDAPEKRLTVYLALNKKLVPVGAAADADLAVVRQQIGNLYLDPKVDKPAEAVPYLLLALNFIDSKPRANPETVQNLAVRAYLGSKQYSDAVTFIAARIQRKKENQELGRAIVQEVDRLDRSNQLNSALDLLNAAKTLPIEGTIRAQLDERDKVLRSRNPARFDWYSDWWNGVVAHAIPVPPPPLPIA